MKPRDYGPFEYSPIIKRPRLTWPKGERVALWVIPNIEFFSLTEKVPAAAGGSGAPVPDVPAWSARDYGNRVGVFRLMAVLDRYGIRATVALNSDLCTQHPAIIEEGQKREEEMKRRIEELEAELEEARSENAHQRKKMRVSDLVSIEDAATPSTPQSSLSTLQSGTASILTRLRNSCSMRSRG